MHKVFVAFHKVFVALQMSNWPFCAGLKSSQTRIKQEERETRILVESFCFVTARARNEKFLKI